ncbi:flagellar basal body rod protein FlgC [Roseovarius aquimarinus]|uniref:Flagellar basal-body rod protein FlgC n=1 Tax=Roseovarius aquimarinus TaxID=1229156 RepID=A0ABW7I5B5_9RHOB
MTIRNIFDVAGSAMSAQMQRLNTTASNLANAQAVSTTAEEAYRPLRPVFETVYADSLQQGALSTAQVTDVITLDRDPERRFQPDHPMADTEGYVFAAAVDPDEEMVEMMEASRQYQNILETVSTLRTLMARTVQMGQ